MEQCVALDIKVILIVAGFPCKGLSRQRGNFRPNLNDKHSALFCHISRVEELFRKACHGKAKVVKHIENVVMQTQPREYISETLGCAPTLVDGIYMRRFQTWAVLDGLPDHEDRRRKT